MHYWRYCISTTPVKTFLILFDASVSWSILSSIMFGNWGIGSLQKVSTFSRAVWKGFARREVSMWFTSNIISYPSIEDPPSLVPDAFYLTILWKHMLYLIVSNLWIRFVLKKLITCSYMSWLWRLEAIRLIKIFLTNKTGTLLIITFLLLLE